MVYDRDKPLFSTDDENAVINPKRAAKTFGQEAAISGALGAAQMGYGALADAYSKTIDNMTDAEFDDYIERIRDPDAHEANPYNSEYENYSDSIDNTSENGIMRPDEYIHKSLGASGKNYPVRLPDGNYAKFAPGTKITKIKVIMGKGTNTPLRNAIFLEAAYGIDRSEWQKVRGEGFIVHKGQTQRVELHWYEAVGQKKRIKMKHLFDKN